jgi:uracil-DNA glycosylase family 4
MNLRRRKINTLILERSTDTFSRSESFAEVKVNISSLQEEIRKCQKCKLGKDSIRVPGTGSEDPILMLLGESPGKNEIETKVPFSGPTSEIIELILNTLSLTEDQIWKTNVLKCQTPQFRNPLNSEIAACQGYLTKEVQILRPDLILAMGRVPSFAVTGSRQTVDRQRGKMHYFHGVKCFVTYHPSAVKRFPFLKAQFLEDLSRLRECLIRKSVYIFQSEVESILGEL